MPYRRSLTTAFSCKMPATKKSNIFSADEVLDAFTLFERAAVTHGHDTANARPARAVPQKPKRSK